MIRTALGFRVKSGFAIAVALRGPAASPAIVARRIVELSDPAFPETRQPYHRGLFTHETDEGALARRIEIVERRARESVTALLADESLGVCTRASLVVGSVIDPAKVGNPHIRAHASEGRLFRTELQAALQARGVRCDVIVDRQLAAKAAARLTRRSADIARYVERFGREIDGPWRADEKAAATAAWMLLR